MNKRLERLLADVDASRGEVGTYEAVSLEFSTLEARIAALESQRDILWALLDDIDTASDRYKFDYEGLAGFVHGMQQKRHDVVPSTEIDESLKRRLGDDAPYFLSTALMRLADTGDSE